MRVSNNHVRFRGVESDSKVRAQVLLYARAYVSDVHSHSQILLNEVYRFCFPVQVPMLCVFWTFCVARAIRYSCTQSLADTDTTIEERPPLGFFTHHSFKFLPETVDFRENLVLVAECLEIHNCIQK